MKNKPYLLNTLLAAVFTLALLVMVLVRAFAPLVILPVADVPNLVLICLVALVLDHYLAPGSKRNYLIAVPLAVVTFGLLPFAAGFATLAQAAEYGLVGGGAFLVTTLLFPTIADRLSSGPAAKASAFFSAVSLYMAAQCLMSII